MKDDRGRSPDDDRAFVRAAISAHERQLLRFAQSLVGPAHAADVVQDTFVALCKAERSQIEGHLVPWLFTVCKNRALDVIRERGRLSALEENDDMQSPDSGPMSRVERQEALGRVERALARLSEQQRQAVLMKFSGGLKYKEIAEVLETSVSNVGFMLHAALKTLRQEMAASELALETERSAQ
jgi:RNA polymerase sigma factor (sigma-70 family)